MQCVYHRSFGFARHDERHRMVYYIENNDTSIQIARHANETGADSRLLSQRQFELIDGGNSRAGEKVNF